MKINRLCKIVATLWPSISFKWVLKQIDKYVDIYKISLSSNDLFKTRQIIKTIRDINIKKVFMLDIKWPEIKTTNEENVKLKKWKIVKIYNKQTSNEISLEYELFSNIPKNIKIFFWNWNVIWQIISNNWNFLEIKIEKWWTIRPNQHVYFDWYRNEINFLTQKDKEDIKFWVEEKIALLTTSFIKSSDEVIKLRNYIKNNYNYEIKIIPKIETFSAINNIDSIIKMSDWIMLTEIWSWEKKVNIIELSKIQSEIIKKCNLAGKPVILATQIAPSMVKNKMPTRDEIDKIVFNMQNWIDVFTLSDETVIWKHPVDTLKILDEIIKKYQQEVHLKLVWDDIKNYVDKENEITDYIIYNAKKMAYKLWVKFIITPTSTWYTTARISSLKPNIPVIAFTDNDKVFKYCNLMFWTYVHKISTENMEYNNFKKTVWETLQKDYRWKIKWEDTILIVHSSKNWNIQHMINWIEIIKFKDL